MNPGEFANIAAAEQNLWWYRGMRRSLCRVMEPWVQARRVLRVLEVGCGTGYFARLLERERGWQVYPTDIAWEGLSHAQRMGHSRLAQADVSALPFASGVFDVVAALDVLPHFAPGEEGQAIREAARVLATGGLLILRAAALDALRSRHSQFVCERQRFTRARLAEATQRCGIRVLRCTYANSLLLPVALAKFRLWEPLLAKAPESGVKPVPGWLDRLLYGCLWLESKWLGGGHDLPLGQSLILVGEKACL